MKRYPESRHIVCVAFWGVLPIHKERKPSWFSLLSHWADSNRRLLSHYADSNRGLKAKLTEHLCHFREIESNFPWHSLGISIPESQLTIRNQLLLIIVVFCQRPKFVWLIFGTVLSQKFGLLSPHQQPPDKGGYFFLSSIRIPKTFSFYENFYVFQTIFPIS